jgi:hypothetical protein
VKAAAIQRGISRATVERAAKEIGIEFDERKTETGRTTYWSLQEGVTSPLEAATEVTLLGRLDEPIPEGLPHGTGLRGDPPESSACELHSGLHRIEKRVAGLVYLTCGCHHPDAAEERQEGARS